MFDTITEKDEERDSLKTCNYFCQICNAAHQFSNHEDKILFSLFHKRIHLYTSNVES